MKKKNYGRREKNMKEGANMNEIRKKETRRQKRRQI